MSDRKILGFMILFGISIILLSGCSQTKFKDEQLNQLFERYDKATAEYNKAFDDFDALATRVIYDPAQYKAANIKLDEVQLATEKETIALEALCVYAKNNRVRLEADERAEQITQLFRDCDANLEERRTCLPKIQKADRLQILWFKQNNQEKMTETCLNWAAAMEDADNACKATYEQYQDVLGTYPTSKINKSACQNINRTQNIS